MKPFARFIALTVAAVTLCGTTAAETRLPDGDGVRGGIVVLLGYADDADAAIEIVNAGQYLVAQVVPAEKAAALRAKLFERGMLGAVTVLDAVVNPQGVVEIPALDETTAVILADGTLKVDEADVLRALRPHGVARLGDGKELRKPWPDDIDDWTHYRYDATSNEYSRDKRVGYISGTQWIAGHSEADASDTLRVADGVAIIPEPGRISAHDAFSGVFLWTHEFAGNWRNRKRPNSQYTHLIHDGRVLIHDRASDHAKALDLYTGALLTVYSEGLSNEAARTPPADVEPDRREREKFLRKAERTLISRKDLAADGVYFQLMGSEICALRVEDGKLLWRHRHPEDMAYDRPAYIDGRLVVSESTHPIDEYMGAYGYMRDTVCRSRAVRGFDGKTGEIVWTVRHDYPGAPTVEAAARHGVYYLGLSDEIDRDGKPSVAPGKEMPVIAVDVQTGELLWDRKVQTLGYSAPAVIASDTHLWFTTHSGAMAHDLKTGEADPIKRTIDKEHLDLWGCNQVWMTEHYVFCRLTAIDVEEGRFRYVTAARSQCEVASVPAHGLLYNKAQTCGCYSFLPANNAVHSLDTAAWRTPWPGQRLHRGSASAAPAKPSHAEDWPMFMRDNLRGNWSPTRVRPQPEEAWSVEMPVSKAPPWIQTEWGFNETRTGPATSVVMAEGVAVYALTDQHTLVALNPDTGEVLWRAHLDGAIDSPPTIHRGAVYAGTRSGSLYALNRDSGEVVWRFMAAPHPRAIAVHGQIESVWPLHGSVSVYQDKVYLVAGRNAELDEGMFWYALSPADGSVVMQGRMHDDQEFFDPETSRTRYERIMGANSPLIIKEGLAVTTRAGFNPDTGDLLSPKDDFTASYYDRSRIDTQDYAIPGMYGWVHVGYSEHTRMGMASSYRDLNGRTFAINGKDVVAHMGGVKPARGGIGWSVFLYRTRDQRGDDGVWGDIPWKQKGEDGPRDGRWGMGLAVAEDRMFYGSTVERSPGIVVRDVSTGEQLGAIKLASPATHLGIGVAHGRLFVATRDGRVVCFK